MVVRLDPLGIVTAKTEPEAKKEVAAWSNDIEGQCPACKLTMTKSYANNIPVHVCAPCMICLPVKDAA